MTTQLGTLYEDNPNRPSTQSWRRIRGRTRI